MAKKLDGSGAFFQWMLGVRCGRFSENGQRLEGKEVGNLRRMR